MPLTATPVSRLLSAWPPASLGQRRLLVRIKNMISGKRFISSRRKSGVDDHRLFYM